jgi:putative addiction module CopG family antidote
MDVVLTRDLERFVEDQVASGRYHSAAEVVEEALRSMMDRERESAADPVFTEIELDELRFPAVAEQPQKLL